jgi:hypothetical protein
MDGGRFDAMTRALAARPSRRGLLGGLGGLAAGLLVRQSGAVTCGPDQINRRGVCVCKTTGRPPGGNGFCPCGSGLTRCGTACVNLTRDVNHCGACDAVCPTGANVADLVCRQGLCRITGCAAGWADCDGQAETGCEKALGTETDCGACGDACADPETCGGGELDGVCGCTDDGTACLGRVCGPATNNCGAPVTCGNCLAEQECTDVGLCTCTPTSCGGCCDAAGLCQLETTEAVCGAGGEVCRECQTGQVCQGGDCVCTETSCGGCCDGTTCRTGLDNDACGTGGELCDRCVEPDTCGGKGVDGVCGSCLVDDDCPAARPCCQAGRCQAAAPPTLADCQSRCDHPTFQATVDVCGQEVACPPCDNCDDLGCLTDGHRLTGPAGDTLYCVGELAGEALCGSACPEDSYQLTCSGVAFINCYSLCVES